MKQLSDSMKNRSI